MAIGPPVLNIVDPEPIGMWLPLVVIFSIAAIMLISYSDRLRILTDERQLVTEHLMFGCICWWRRRWKVQEGDYLAVQISGHEKEPLTPEFRYFHALCVYRGDRPRIIAYVFTKERDISDMDRAANRSAELLGLPYEGYREMEPGSLYSAKLPNSE